MTIVRTWRRSHTSVGRAVGESERKGIHALRHVLVGKLKSLSRPAVVSMLPIGRMYHHLRSSAQASRLRRTRLETRLAECRSNAIPAAAVNVPNAMRVNARVQEAIFLALDRTYYTW